MAATLNPPNNLPVQCSTFMGRERPIVEVLEYIRQKGIRRDPTNRRIRVLELTEAGEARFLQLRNAAVAFDRQLRAGLNARDVASFTRVLGRLDTNVASHDER